MNFEIKTKIMNTETQKRLIDALNENIHLQDEEKKHWYEQAQNMPEELIDILVHALTAKEKTDFDSLKKRVAQRQKELKEYATKLMTEGIQNLYKKAEEVSENEDSNKEEELLRAAEEEEQK